MSKFRFFVCTVSGHSQRAVSPEFDVVSSREKNWQEKWHTDLLGCCSEPYLCMFSSHKTVSYRVVDTNFITQSHYFSCNWLSYYGWVFISKIVLAGVKTFLCPCDTLSKVASVATGKEMCECH